MVPRKRQIEKLGLFMTDASFDSKSKLASIAIVNLKTKHVESIQKHLNSVGESETNGIIEALKLGIGKYSNIVIFCDNQGSVAYVSDKVKSSDFWSTKYLTIQIIWLPREETYLADFFTKNITDSDKNMQLKIDSFKKECKTTNVMDLFLSINDKHIIIKDLFSDSFKEFNLLNDFKFKSTLLNSIFERNIFREKTELDLKEMKEDCELLFKIEPKLFKKESPFFQAMQGLLNTN